MPYVYQTKRKDGTPHPRWKFQYTDYRKKRRTATGTTSKKGTEELAAQVEAQQKEIRKGWRPAPKASDVPRPIQETVDEYVAWGESQGGRQGHPWGQTHARMRRSHLAWWQEQLGVELVADLVGVLPRVEKALRDVQTSGRSGKTLANRAEALGAFCDWCLTRGYLDQDPLRHLGRFDTSPRSRRRAMTAEEIAKLLESCAPHRRICYEVAFASGLRAGELRALRVRHLDRAAGGLRLEAAWTKNRRAGFQPLPVWLVDRLEDVAAGKAADEPLLYVPSHPARDLEEDLKRAGIPKLTAEGKLDFHACRVAFVTWVLEAGATVKEAQALARHVTPDLTMNTYARTRGDRLSNVAEAVGRNLRNITGAEQPAGVVLTASGDGGYAAGTAGSIPAASTDASASRKLCVHPLGCSARPRNSTAGSSS